MALCLIVSCIWLGSCSHDEEVRMPEDILGVWSPFENFYLDFDVDHIVRQLSVETQDGESIGVWKKDVYFYEPGYNLVIYLSSEQTAEVYEIVEMTDSRLTWCWVKDIDADDVRDAESVGQLLGEIIKEAQEGFHLDPANYQTFNRVAEEDFLNLLDSLDYQTPW